MFDLGVEDGTIVTPTGKRAAHIYVSDGTVRLISQARKAARVRLDATGKLVMPGMVDAHVHFMDPSEPDREDFVTGSLAAAVAGVTTILEHTHSSPVTTAEELKKKRIYLQDRSLIDFGLGAHAFPTRIDDVQSLWDAGPTFLKAFTCTTHGIPGWDYGQLFQLFKKARQLQATCLVHCEDDSLVLAAENSLRAEERDDPGLICEWRNPEAEMVSVGAVGLLARRTGARVVIAHISGKAALEMVRSKEPQLFAESCPQYFLLRESEVHVHGSLRKFTPPARARSGAELDEMWKELERGSVDYMASDHAPSSLASKKGPIWDTPFGLPGIDTTFGVLLDAASKGKITYERVVEAYSEKPSRIYGLFPKKGSLEIGADADLVIVDPGAEWRISRKEIRSKAAWSPFGERKLHGRATTTILRGRVVVHEGEVLADHGWGRFVPGPGSKR